MLLHRTHRLSPQNSASTNIAKNKGASYYHQTVCYVGSANLTGAGMGMKSPHRRNFEAGILSDEPSIVSAAIEEFDKVWRGSECGKCQRRNVCPDPIV